jgi:hypothetical protein
LPHIKALYEQRYAEDPEVAFVLVSLDDDAKRLQRYLAKMNFPFTVVHSSFDTVGAKYNVTNTPTTFYIDKTGVIRFMTKGGEGEARIVRNIEELKNK